MVTLRDIQLQVKEVQSHCIADLLPATICSLFVLTVDHKTKKRNLSTLA